MELDFLDEIANNLFEELYSKKKRVILFNKFERIIQKTKVNFNQIKDKYLFLFISDDKEYTQYGSFFQNLKFLQVNNSATDNSIKKLYTSKIGIPICKESSPELIPRLNKAIARSKVKGPSGTCVLQNFLDIFRDQHFIDAKCRN